MWWLWCLTVYYQVTKKWLENLIRTWNKGSTQELAQAVVAEAIKHRNDGHDDDITVLAVKLTDNE